MLAKLLPLPGAESPEASLQHDLGETLSRSVRWPSQFVKTAVGTTHEIAALDGIRAVAVLLVVWHHLYWWGSRDWAVWDVPILRDVAKFGFTGVLLFFVLSGFLLFLPYARAIIDAQAWPSALAFYRRRALRILPVYYAALAVVGLLLAAEHALHGWLIRGLALSFLLVQNMSGTAAHFVGVVDGVLWTLAIEWQFYLLLPWIALAIAKFAHRGVRNSDSRGSRAVLARVGIALGVLVLVGLSTRALSAVLASGLADGDSPILIRQWLIQVSRVVCSRYLEEFAVGMALSVVYVVIVEQRRYVLRRFTWFGGLALVAVLPGLIGCYFWAQHLGVFQGENFWGVIPAGGWMWNIFGVWVCSLCFALLLFATLIGPAIIRRGLSLALLRLVGIISYSVYIWHLPIVNLVRNTWVALLVICLLSLLSYYLIERPFLRRRSSAPRHAPQ